MSDVYIWIQEKYGFSDEEMNNISSEDLNKCMLEYLDEKEETSNVLEKINGEIWLHTGDIGFIDSKGLLHYKVRLKRMIITSGYNVYPANVENIIIQHSL